MLSTSCISRAVSKYHQCESWGCCEPLSMQSRAGVSMAEPFLQPRDWGAVLGEFGLSSQFFRAHQHAWRTDLLIAALISSAAFHKSLRNRPQTPRVRSVCLKTTLRARVNCLWAWAAFLSVTRSRVKMREQLTGHLFMYLIWTFTSLLNSSIQIIKLINSVYLCVNLSGCALSLGHTHPSHFKPHRIPVGVSLGMHALHLDELHSPMPP